MVRERPAVRNRVYWAGALAATAVFMGIVVANEWLLGPEAAEPLLRALGNLAYPPNTAVRFGLTPIWPIANHHWPWQNILAAAAITPLAGFAAFRWLVIPAARLARRWTSARRETAPPAEAATNHRVPRRRFLATAAGGAAVVGAGLYGYAALVEPGLVQVRRYRLAIRDLPSGLDGLRIVQVSDTHYGPVVSLAHVRAVIRRAQAEAPDLAVLTGDYVHRTHRAIPDGVGVLDEFRGRLGTVAVLGNHDHWEGADAFYERFRAIGLPLLDHKTAWLTARGLALDGPPPAGALCLAGLGDLWEDESSPDDVLQGVPRAMPRIVLSHNPDAAELSGSARTRVDAMLSGHTHGGQVWLPGLGAPITPSRYGQKYVGGLCRGPHFPVYVSRGAGLAMVPVRFGVPPEISVIEVARA